MAICLHIYAYACTLLAHTYQDAPMNEYSPLHDLPLSTRTQNLLKAGGINTCGDLANASPTALLMVPNLGRKTLSEIEAVFSSGLLRKIEKRQDERWMKRVSIMLPVDMIAALNEVRNNTGVPVSETIRMAIRSELARREAYSPSN